MIVTDGCWGLAAANARMIRQLERDLPELLSFFSSTGKTARSSFLHKQLDITPAVPPLTQAPKPK